MTERERCSALQANSTCKNGFPVTGTCHGADGGIPICMNEAVCARIYAAHDGVPPVIARAAIDAALQAKGVAE
jgi:hypothetical protein